MRRLKTTKRFERDLKRTKKRGKPLDKLWAVVEQLLKDETAGAETSRAYALRSVAVIS